MYLSAERLALANEVVKKTFEDTSIAWQTIPHWYTGDPGQTYVQSDSVPPSAPIAIIRRSRAFKVTLAQASAPTPDGLLATLITNTVILAKVFDYNVIGHIRWNAIPLPLPFLATIAVAKLQGDLIDARARLENAGYRSASCLLTNTAGLKALSQVVSGSSIVNTLLTTADVNSLNRTDRMGVSLINGRIVLLGRRQRISHRGGPQSSPGEEPVDLAVSVPPSLEVVGDDGTGNLDFVVRIRYATRIKDAHGITGVV